VSNGKRYVFKKILGKGSYGVVELYVNTIDRNDKIVLKTFMSDNDAMNEKLVVNKLGSACDQYRILAVDISSKPNALLLEACDGTLYELSKKDSIKPARVLLSVAKALYCLAQHDLWYTDMKAANVLYKWVDKSKCYRIYLGDLGSAVGYSKESVASYPYPHGFDPNYMGAGHVLGSDVCVAYGLFILALSLLKNKDVVEALDLLRFERLIDPSSGKPSEPQRDKVWSDACDASELIGNISPEYENLLRVFLNVDEDYECCEETDDSRDDLLWVLKKSVEALEKFNQRSEDGFTFD
jgi:serine/threonine protein kinase